MLCGLQYKRSGGLNRHYFSAHQLVRRQGLLSAVGEDESAVRQEALRRQQMSSRRRRRLRASLAAVEERPWRVATMSSIPTATDGVEGWAASPWSDSGFTLPELADVTEPETLRDGVHREVQTEPVVVLPAPPVFYHSACQTEPAVARSIGVNTDVYQQNWPSRVSARELTNFVRDRPRQTFNQMEAEARLRWTDLSAEESSLVRGVMLGIAWGLEFQASHILGTVAEAQDDRIHGPEILIGLNADLVEQASRHY